MHIEIGNTKIPVVLRRSSRGGIRLRFQETNPVLLVESPTGDLDATTRNFLVSKGKWIQKHYRQRLRSQKQREHFFASLRENRLLLFGRMIRLDFQLAPKRTVRLQDDALIVRHLPADVPNRYQSLLYGALRGFAKNWLTKRTQLLAQKTNSNFAQVRIKDHKSKWGSCSGKRNINLNWHLIFLPQPLIDYVIIHELMHLREMNHSPRFWAEVARYVPDYKKARKAVHDHGWLIGIFESG